MVYVWNMYGDVLGACGVSMHVFQTYPPSPMRVLQAPFPRPQQKQHIFLCTGIAIHRCGLQKRLANLSIPNKHMRRDRFTLS